MLYNYINSSAGFEYAIVNDEHTIFS